MMFDALFKALDHDMPSFADAIDDLHSFMSNFSEEYMKDGDAKDAAIDAFIAYLQTLKSKKNG